MRYCTSCHNLTAGTPLFCSTCGSTYDLRLCPRLHPNPRSAQICSQCGSRDLSQPEPEVSFITRWLWMASRLWGFIALTLVSLFIGLAFVHVIVTDIVLQGQLLVILLFVGLLWWGYTQLPARVRGGVGRMVGKQKKDGGRHH
jgi:RNA polymerase subunit RPABC4/transcription elongation factor Spt4